MRPLFAVLVAVLFLVGCHDKPDPRLYQVRTWVRVIREAGLVEYADLGDQLLSTGRVVWVDPPRLGQQFNAWTDLRSGTILLNSPLLARYPDPGDRAAILLHELVHVCSGEATHSGPWWTVCDEFAVWRAQWKNGAKP